MGLALGWKDWAWHALGWEECKLGLGIFIKVLGKKMEMMTWQHYINALAEISCKYRAKPRFG